MFAHDTRPSARRGFTLIELLVVMGVIAILMTILVPTLSRIRQTVGETRTNALIEGLSMALDIYRTAHNAYPPDKHPAGTNQGQSHAGLDKTSECLVYFLSGASIVYVNGQSPATYPWRHALYWDSSTAGVGRKAYTISYTFKDNVLTDKDGDLAPEIIDHWGKRLIYNSGGTTNGTWNQLEAPRYAVGKFDIFSAGYDGKYGTDDDLRSWGSSPRTLSDYNWADLNAGDF